MTFEEIERRLEREELIDKVLNYAATKKGIAIAQICRSVNERGLSYCNQKTCYANNNKRKNQFIPKPVCKFHQNTIRRLINFLEKEGRLKTMKARRSDHWQPRGWDWMRSVYIPEDFPEEKFEVKTL